MRSKKSRVGKLKGGDPVRLEHRKDENAPKLTPIRRQGTAPKRNGPCPCGSKIKFKRCCGRVGTDPTRKSPYKTMASQYTPEQRAAEAAFVKQWGFNPNLSQLATFMDDAHGELKASILRGLTNIKAGERFHYAVEKLNCLITPKNQRLVSTEEAEAWEAALAEYDDEHGRRPADGGSVGAEVGDSPAVSRAAPASEGGDATPVRAVDADS